MVCCHLRAGHLLTERCTRPGLTPSHFSQKRGQPCPSPFSVQSPSVFRDSFALDFSKGGGAQVCCPSKGGGGRPKEGTHLSRGPWIQPNLWLEWILWTTFSLFQTGRSCVYRVAASFGWFVSVLLLSVPDTSKAPVLSKTQSQSLQLGITATPDC